MKPFVFHSFLRVLQVLNFQKSLGFPEFFPMKGTKNTPLSANGSQQNPGTSHRRLAVHLHVRLEGHLLLDLPAKEGPCSRVGSKKAKGLFFFVFVSESCFF